MWQILVEPIFIKGGFSKSFYIADDRIFELSVDPLVFFTYWGSTILLDVIGRKT